MRLSLGLVLSFVLHSAFVAYALFWAGSQPPRVNMDRPVYTVDLVSLAPPPPGPAPVVEVAPQATPEAQVPVVEAAPESAVEVKEAPVVEAKPEPEPEPKAEKISEKKVEKKTIVKKKEETPKPKPKPKPKPQKTAEQLRKEALAAAKAAVKKEEAAKARALQKELAALKKQEGGEDVYAHGGQPGGVEGGVQGGTVGATGSGLSEVYALIVGQAIKKNWRYPTFSGDANLVVTVEMVLDAEGKILSSKVVESSGNPEFDSSALRAIKETEYVERPRTDRDRLLRINFNSQELFE